LPKHEVRIEIVLLCVHMLDLYRGAGKSLTQPGTKQVTATEVIDFYISYL